MAEGDSVVSGRMHSPSLQLAWTRVPWDSAACGFPVVSLDRISLQGRDPEDDFRAFEGERDRLGVGLVSCRLAHTQMAESMFLESRDFRFIEMLYRPELALTSGQSGLQDPSLTVSFASAADVPELTEIAGSAFRNERFRLDHRLDPKVNDRRYQAWVASSLTDPVQRLRVIRDGGRIVAFFITELLPDGTCHWHLNAIANDLQGRGYGRRVWHTMIRQAAQEGAQRVRSSIVAGNVRVVNLYARLGFRFQSPCMTFHWVRVP